MPQTPGNKFLYIFGYLANTQYRPPVIVLYFLPTLSSVIQYTSDNFVFLTNLFQLFYDFLFYA